MSKPSDNESAKKENTGIFNLKKNKKLLVKPNSKLRKLASLQVEEPRDRGSLERQSSWITPTRVSNNNP